MQCMRCGLIEHVQEHHMAYGSQPKPSKIPLCNECHESYTDMHRQEKKEYYVNRNPYAKYIPNKAWKQRL